MRQAGGKLLVLLLVGAAYFLNALGATAAETPAKIQLETKDKVILFGLYKKVEKPEAVVILLPMLSKTKASWKRVQEVLAEKDKGTLSIENVVRASLKYI